LGHLDSLNKFQASGITYHLQTVSVYFRDHHQGGILQVFVKLEIKPEADSSK